MCGIVGIYLKSKKFESSLGNMLSDMLINMGSRGPDSAGFAVYKEDEDENYWDSDNNRSPEVVETIQFSYFGDQMSVVYESGTVEEGPNFNPFIFDTSEFYGNSGDYAIVIEFTNDLGSDDSVKQGQSNWKWFHICNTNSDGSCSD